ncbi:VWA domain-containing protein [Propionibacteriaceae bacterium G1746]|uniref:VWA domain-containing protein n=1 Tax=Aestuariimicrobium sp. G57 TaxID=3418485 RepID=UPI003C21CD48
MALMSLEFMLPQRLWWLLVVPAIGLLYLYLNSLRPRSRKRASKLDLVLPRDKAWKRHVAVLTALLAIASLVVAYAKPKDFTEVPRERATVVLAIDVSRSMMAEDVEPNRLEAAQVAAKDFLGLLPKGFNVSLVAFSGTASLVVPPTTDRGVVSRAIDGLELAPSTAIGDGIYESLDALKLVPPDPNDPNSTAPAAIVLLSDGATNTGRSSLQAARDSKKQGVPIYTIAYGTATGYVEERGVRQPVPVNHRELADVADASGGKKLSAASDRELAQAYQEIARSIGYEKVYVEVTERYAGWALLFGILAALATMSLAARWP